MIDINFINAIPLQMIKRNRNNNAHIAKSIFSSNKLYAKQELEELLDETLSYGSKYIYLFKQ